MGLSCLQLAYTLLKHPELRSQRKAVLAEAESVGGKDTGTTVSVTYSVTPLTA
jgi:hypothetical protein